jgi:Na+/H+ antiporter NhaD/arsenite permease-like protein
MAGLDAPDLTGATVSLFALAIFVIAYGFVIAEEFTSLRKSKPIVIAAGAIWIVVAIAYAQVGRDDVGEVLRHQLTEYAELLLFLLAAMTYVNTLQERQAFGALRSWLVARRLSYRSIYWLTGAAAFVLSPVLDNLTTALVMGAVVLSVGKDNPRFLVPGCINIVVAANAGGAFSPFGDITTLMVWQKGLVSFIEFFDLFVPSVVNWLVPALCMQLAITRGMPEAEKTRIEVKPGGYAIIGLFAFTIAMTVAMHQYLHLPPFIGMMTGMGLLMVYGFFIRRQELSGLSDVAISAPTGLKSAHRPFDVFISAKRVEWDTLLFFYGVILCVGGLGALGYLALLSEASYVSLGPTTTNVLVGVASAIVDNIPIMFAVLSMNPEMSHGQWLLVTLTAGVGGSLLSIGSAAGVALMGQAHGVYTFVSHLKWTWAIALGYAASIWVHFLVNARTF